MKLIIPVWFRLVCCGIPKTPPPPPPGPIQNLGKYTTPQASKQTPI